MTDLKEPKTSARPFAGRQPKQGKRTNGDTPEARVASDAAARSRRQKADGLVLGRAPRVDLLPTEVLVDRRQRATVRRAWGGVVVVAVLTVLGIAAATTYAGAADAHVTAARANSDSLSSQLAQYAKVRKIQQDTALLRAAQEVGGSTEVDWANYLNELQFSVPSSMTITGVTIDSATPMQAYQQSTGPLEGQRIATITVDASSPTLPSVPSWLDSVTSLTGYVDANASSVSLDPTSNLYTVDMTIHVNEKAFDKKYKAKGN